MARKVIGPTGSRRRRWLFLCTSFAAIAIAVVFIPSALAVHDLRVPARRRHHEYGVQPADAQLESVEYDWNDIFNVTNNAPVRRQRSVRKRSRTTRRTWAAERPSMTRSFTRDFETNATCPTTSAVGLDSLSTNFCTGDDTTYATGSKDTLGIGNGGWQCNHDNNVNSKIDIMNAYVAQYTDPANGAQDLLLRGGEERQQRHQRRRRLVPPERCELLGAERSPQLHRRHTWTATRWSSPSKPPAAG